MTNFDELDIDKGFVLDNYNAIMYINDIALQHTREIMDGYEDAEGFSEIIGDLRDMREEIEKNDYAYIKFEYHPMAAAQFIIKEMTEKE